MEETNSPDEIQTTDEFNCECEILLNEYTHINSRITRELESDDRSFEFILLAFAATVGALTYALDKGYMLILLFLPLPFYILTWAQARRIIWVAYLTKYHRSVLAPRLNTIIHLTNGYQDPLRKPIHFQGWEEYVLSSMESRKTLNSTLAFPHIGKAMLQLLVGIAFLIAYFAIRQPGPFQNLEPIEVIAAVINILSILTSMILLIIATRERISISSDLTPTPKKR